MSLFSNTSWVVKYKLYHLPFWLVYHLAWTSIYIGNFEDVVAYLGSINSIKLYFYVVFQVIGVYVNLYYLIPNFLYKRVYSSYILALFLLVFSCTAFITCGYYMVAHFSNQSFYEIFKKQPDEFWSIFFTNALPSTLASMTLAMSIKLGKNWLSAEKKQLTLQKENLETELKYLKSQINPHFLFNTINSIFALIHKNPDLASESLANFSGMLRYQLYECNEEETELAKELDFLENFIDLESLRLDETHTELKFEIQRDSLSGRKIAPFILIPFVENAFKHVSKGRAQNNYIRMQVLANERELDLSIRNSVAEGSKTIKGEEECSGIGLKNVKRRLDLIYPERHYLEVVSNADSFKIHLNIKW
ncbi:histidine kinase [uncultured Arcticibacterium sp.]|uniref:sensor histidine kinase n=1 Tax=uncultured Arcticibacterium sp. TaxID=2173042 RepID=UPI0030F946E8